MCIAALLYVLINMFFGKRNTKIGIKVSIKIYYNQNIITREDLYIFLLNINFIIGFDYDIENFE